MISLNSNQVAYLRTSRPFPQDPQALSVEIDKAYVDIANAVNVRTIGLFATNRSSITGQLYFLNGTRQQSSRQIYTITGAGNYAHGISFSKIGGFVNIYGTYFDGTDWYPIGNVNTVAFANQVSVKVTPTNIVITAGGSVTIRSGFIVLEWLNNV